MRPPGLVAIALAAKLCQTARTGFEKLAGAGALA